MDAAIFIRIQSIITKLDDLSEALFHKIDRYEGNLLKNRELNSNIEIKPFKIKSPKIGIFFQRFHGAENKKITVNDNSIEQEMDDVNTNENEKFTISFFQNLL